jgi:AcrR family transcriptional regulator
VTPRPSTAEPPPQVLQNDTKARLLDAMVRIFAEHGFHATSMRAVTQLAGTSVSAAHYHFGSKEELLRAALRQRAEPLNTLRLARLDEVERSAKEGRARVAEILDAFISPLIELRLHLGDDDHPRRNLAARLYLDPSEVVRSMQQELFGPVTLRFRRALEKSLPDVSPETIEVALQLSLGVVVHSISGRFSWPESGKDSSGTQRRQAAKKLVSFAVAGVLAVAEVDEGEAQ